MNRLARPLTLAASLAVTSLFATTASADLPPPAGTKFVDFAVSLENLAAFPEMVIVAYPWSTSNGAPTTEHAALKDGKPLDIGRRSSTPKLWAIAKTDYEAFLSKYKPTGSFEDPALEELFKSDKVRACSGEIARESQLPDSDPRDRIVQSFRVEAVDKTRCTLVASTSKANDGSSKKGGSAEPSASGAGDRGAGDRGASAPAPSGEPAAPGKGGCAGCATSSAEGDRAGGFIAMAVAVFGGLIATRRRRGRSSPALRAGQPCVLRLISARCSATRKNTTIDSNAMRPQMTTISAAMGVKAICASPSAIASCDCMALPAAVVLSPAMMPAMVPSPTAIRNKT